MVNNCNNKLKFVNYNNKFKNLIKLVVLLHLLLIWSSDTFQFLNWLGRLVLFSFSLSLLQHLGLFVILDDLFFSLNKLLVLSLRNVHLFVDLLAQTFEITIYSLQFPNGPPLVPFVLFFHPCGPFPNPADFRHCKIVVVTNIMILNYLLLFSASDISLGFSNIFDSWGFPEGALTKLRGLFGSIRPGYND